MNYSVFIVEHKKTKTDYIFIFALLSVCFIALIDSYQNLFTKTA